MKKSVIRGIGICLLAATLLLCSCSPTVAEKDGQAVNGVQTENFNILVTGRDRQSGLADVWMLVSVNEEAETVCVLQLPRDTYAAYTDGNYRKLNGAVYSLGSFDQVKAFLGNALGISVDRYIDLSPDAFVKGVDALGGVEVELDRTMYYNDPDQDLYIYLPRGKTLLDGEKAEQFVRYRSGYVTGDLGRMDAQKVFLGALLRTVKENMSPLTLAKLALALLPEVKTDLTLADIWKLSELACGADGEKILLVTAPGEEATAEKSGASYYVLSAPSMEEVLCTYFGAEAGGFDQEHVFLNGDYSEFRRIYGQSVPYEAVTANEVGKTP